MNIRNALPVLAGVALLAACSNSGDEAAGPAVSAPAEPAATAAQTAKDQAPEGRVFFVSPSDGANVSSPVNVVFGIEGFSVAPAGTYDPATGHHHLLIDTDLPPLDMPIPADENHVHFGAGQTETTVELTPGEHTLQLVLGDGNHVPHDPPLVSDVITITVVE